MSNLSLSTVEKLIHRHLPFIDVATIDEILSKEISQSKTTESTQAIRESLLDSFRRNLNQDTVAYIRNQLVRHEATGKRSSESIIRGSSSFHEDTSTQNFSDLWRSLCGELNLPGSSSNSRQRSTVPICLSYPFLSNPSSIGFREENEHVLPSVLRSVPPSVLRSVPSFQIPWGRAESSDLDSERSSLQYSEFPSARYNCSIQFVKARNIRQILSFLMTHLLTHTPCDPVRFLIKLIDALIDSRDKGHALPLLYGKDELTALFSRMDLPGRGYITYRQYKGAMKTLGVSEKDPVPSTVVSGTRIPFDIYKEDSKQNIGQTLINDVLRPSLQTKRNHVITDEKSLGC